MSPAASRQFRALAVEAVLDAVRRRVVAAIAVLSLLGLWLVQSCTGAWSVTNSGQPMDSSNLLGWTSTILFGTLALGWASALTTGFSAPGSP